MLTDPQATENLHAPALTPLAQLLERARAAHTEFQESAPRTMEGHQVGSLTKARDALDRAYEAREQADVLDPDHSDPAWRDDALTHDHTRLMAFYREERKLRG